MGAPVRPGATLLRAGVVCGALLITPIWTAAASAADFNPGPGTYTINTSTAPPTLTGPGGTNISGTVSNGVAVFSFGNVNIPSTVTVNAAGSLPLEIVATGSFSLAGTINASGANATNFTAGANLGGPGGGAGGADGAHGGSGPGGGGVGSTSNDGGGGGGFGGAGARGGADGGTAGTGGSVYGNLTATLQGGSGGAGGTTGGSNMAGGGGGGGAIELSADSLLISGAGQVLAKGGAGALGGFGASGGGSGGGIIVRANAMNITGTLSAVGGAGGTGGCCGDGGGGGGGRILYEYGTLAASGTSSVAGGASGSAGGGASSHPSVDATGAPGVVATIQGAIVTSKPATGVSTTAATLNGLVDPNGSLTAYHFDYGTTTAYGSQMPASDNIVGADLTDHSVSQSLAGLTPGTTYHYRLVATDATGLVTRSPDGMFTTGPAATVAASTQGPVATMVVHCQGVGGQSCAGAFALIAHETTVGGSVTAVSAARHKKRPRPVTRQVTLGQGTYSVAGGASQSIPLRVNATGLRILAQLGKLPATLTFTATSASAPASQTIQFTYARIHPRISARSRRVGAAVSITRLTVGAIPAGGRLSVGCAGRGCPFAHKAFGGKSGVSLTRLFRKAHLKPGARITVTVTAPNSVTSVTTWVVTAKLKLVKRT